MLGLGDIVLNIVHSLQYNGVIEYGGVFAHILFRNLHNPSKNNISVKLGKCYQKGKL